MASNKLAKGLKRSALTVALSMCFVGAALAQSTGGLRITITSPDGQPVAGATVKASSPSSLVSKTGTTSADGSVNLSGLDPAVNYTIEVTAAGFNNFNADHVAVVSGQNRSLGYILGSGSAGDATNLDAVVVVGSGLATVDTTSAVVSTVLTLDMVESLPTGRSYTDYLQLVPGVKPTTGSNPSSKSGINYQDIGGAVGASSDNVYLLDGVDVTNPNSGYAGSGFNSEIIQEQQVLTGGVPAEFAGGSGLVSKVITKSGSNEFHGSINYYLQNDSLVSDYKHEDNKSFSTYDTAITLGGPIVKDKLWFFGSYQKKHRTEDVPYTDNDPLYGQVQRTVDNDTEYRFFKTTWQITDNHRLSALAFDSPTESSGSTAKATTNQANRTTKTSGLDYKIDYQGSFGDNLLVNAYYFQHEGETAIRPVDPSPANTVRYYITGSETRPTSSQSRRGGLGYTYDYADNRDEYGLNLEYFIDTSWGTHTLKAGYSSTDNELFDNYNPVDGVTYQSLALEDSGMSFQNYSTTSSSWVGNAAFNLTNDYNFLIDGINASASRAAIYGQLDTNSDGTISQAELGALTFTDTAGNPHGQVNVKRTRTTPAPYTVNAKGKTFYLQDTWTQGQWTVNAGVRAEKWDQYDATAGETFFTFDWEYAPRLSVVYDVFNDGNTKVWGFYGRYYDQMRTNITDFGKSAGAATLEDININGTWVQYRDRGGPGSRDAQITPNTKTPYTDEFLIGFSTAFNKSWNFSATITKRVTKDILEDYNLYLYSDDTVTCGEAAGEAIGTLCPDNPMFIPLSYFGYDSWADVPDANFWVGTLRDGKREYLGVELTLQKVKSDNWQGMVSYTHNSAYGNTNSDSNADFQGDWPVLDPGAPNRWGKQPGNIEHQFKAFGAYYWDNGFEVSGVFNWNSGAILTPSFLTSSRHLPVMSDGYWWEGVYDSWIEPGTMGSIKSPSYYTLDMRAKYTRPLGFGKIELFVDVFNILDKQSTTVIQDLIGGDNEAAYMGALDWVEPRRFYLGARYSF